MTIDELTKLAAQAVEQDAKATPGPWRDFAEMYRKAMLRVKKASGRWYHGRSKDSLPLTLICQDSAYGESITDDDIPMRVDIHDMRKVFCARGQRGNIYTQLDGLVKPEDMALICSARTREPQLARALLKLMPFVSHSEGCTLNNTEHVDSMDDIACDCGLDAALKGLE